MRLRKRPTLAVLFVSLAASVGCLNEYHPEYSPHTSYAFSQNVSYPTTVVQNVVAPPSPRPPPGPSSPRALPTAHRGPVAPSADGAGRLDLAARETPRPIEPPRDIESRPRLADESTIRTSAPEEERVGPERGVDLAAARRRCRAGDAASCAALPGIHSNRDLRLYRNVVLFGDVFLNDGLARSEGGEGRQP
jgi:hypothetical protein